MEIDIVSFNIPYPPTYGGVIDVFYKLKALAEAGADINLHCFEYNRQHSEELNKYCKNVYYYKRYTGLKSFFSAEPYVVKSRANLELYKRLKSSKGIILMEGIHTTHFMDSLLKSGKKVIVRTHNVESDYYFNLSKNSRGLKNKIYHYTEAIKLKSYEKRLKNATGIMAISKNDAEFFKRINKNTIYVPAFHPNDKVNSLTGKGDYILYHGNLSVPENSKAAEWLIDNIFSKVKYKCVIAGYDPPKSLLQLSANYDNVEIVVSPDESKMQQLIQYAHINILYTNQATGIKLKLLNSLYNGRFCLANSLMTDDTGVENICYKWKTPAQALDLIRKLMAKSFDDDLKNEREKFLSSIFDNKVNANKVIDFISSL